MASDYDTWEGRDVESEQDRYMSDYEQEGAFMGHVKYMSETPIIGDIIDPGGFFSGSGTDKMPLHQVSERLSPDVQRRMQRSIDTAQRLRDRPLLSGMKARAAGQRGLQRQAAAMAGGSPEAQISMRRQGAGMGANILGQYGGQMAGESVERYNVGLKMAQAAEGLEKGQVIFGLGEKVRNYLARKGVQLNEQQARAAAMGAIASFTASQTGKKKKEEEYDFDY